MPGQARLGAGTGQVGAAGSGSETAESGLPWPGRQCVMVMLTCPTFVIHLCDNWDRCFHVHPQCVSNQGQRLVNTVQDNSRATSPDRTTSSVAPHTSLQLQPQPSVVLVVTTIIKLEYLPPPVVTSRQHQQPRLVVNIRLDLRNMMK